VPELSSSTPAPVIWDDDGSIDGVTALLYLLQHGAFDVQAATISPGIAHPQIFAPKLGGLFAQLQIEGVPIAAGPEQPLAGDNAFPEDWRIASDNFWGLSLPDGANAPDPRGAAQLMVDLLRASEQPVTIFVSGPLTNLAEALRIDREIRDQVRAVEIMGGALNVGGNVSLDAGTLPAEWNIYIDPLAAAEVFASGVEIHLTPLDATDRVQWGEEDARAWEASAAPTGAMAARLLRQTMADWSALSVLVWDLVAAVNASDRSLCGWQAVHIEVAIEAGTTEGQTVVVASEAANASACLDPDARAYKDLAEAVFGGAE
jgi:purine nucleosidase/pyrimidine-specific ribonucleoside hydrolase